MNPQLEGIEAITGTYAFDLRVSNRTLKLNRFFWHMIWRNLRLVACHGSDHGAGRSARTASL